MKIVNLEDIPFTKVSHDSDIQKQVLLRAGELGPITQFAQAVFPAGATVKSHTHADMGEVFLVQSGTGQIFIEGTDYPLEPGTCAMVNNNEAHEVQNTGNVDLVITYFGVKV